MLRFHFCRAFLEFADLLLLWISWSSWHFWKFSTTTPTIIFNTKNPPIRRKEMKYNICHCAWFVRGWKVDIRKESGKQLRKRQGQYFTFHLIWQKKSAKKWPNFRLVTNIYFAHRKNYQIFLLILFFWRLPFSPIFLKLLSLRIVLITLLLVGLLLFYLLKLNYENQNFLYLLFFWSVRRG